MTPLLRILSTSEIAAVRRAAFSEADLAQTRTTVDDVRRRGEAAVREWSERFGDLAPNDRIFYDASDLERARRDIGSADRELLERTAERIRRFADMQRSAIRDEEMAIPGGRAGHRFTPIQRAGCYAPGGRYPLPSSILMTAVVARAAGVETVLAASPKPTPVTLAAAAVAGAEGLLALGGAQAIAALAFGIGGCPPCDAVVGPGNRWVTAAKHVVSSDVAIDMLAGPSELAIIADGVANPAMIAADLLAQAEHDPDALPILITTEPDLLTSVERELRRQLMGLPTRDIARKALANGFAVVVQSLPDAVEAANRIAPEHLEVLTQEPRRLLPHLRHYGTIFLGESSAEVFGDYGVGPNHTLPTGGTARHAAGLSVLTFLRAQTWISIAQPPRHIVNDIARFARLEGLEAHARAAEARQDDGRCND